jgi:hypothetical protein
MRLIFSKRMPTRVVALPLLAVALALLGITGCKRDPLFPNEPYIEFVRIEPTEVHEASGITLTNPPRIVIRFRDGDGDLGSSNSQQFNFFLEDSRTERLPLLDSTVVGYDSTHVPPRPVYAYDTLYTGLIKTSMPDLTPEARNPSIQGELVYTFTTGLNRLPTADPFNPLPPRDTVRFRIYMVDRAGNRSNTIETDYFVVLPPE